MLDTIKVEKHEQGHLKGLVADQQKQPAGSNASLTSHKASPPAGLSPSGAVSFSLHFPLLLENSIRIVLVIWDRVLVEQIRKSEIFYSPVLVIHAPDIWNILPTPSCQCFHSQNIIFFSLTSDPMNHVSTSLQGSSDVVSKGFETRILHAMTCSQIHSLIGLAVSAAGTVGQPFVGSGFWC